MRRMREMRDVLCVGAWVWVLGCLGVWSARGEESRTEALDSGAWMATETEIAARLACLETDIPLHHNRYVQSFIKYFAEKDRPYTRRVLALQQRYFPIFEHYLAKYGLPDELKYLAVVESGLRPEAISRAGAVGLWQFIPSTGRYYGLQQSTYVDDRRDPYKATEAACLFLRELYQRFGDWELALAAFNSGPGRVSRAIRRSGHRSFWKLYRYLPRETRAYVPQFVAITYIFNYHYYHNLFPTERFYMAASDTIHVRTGLDLRVLAESASLCKEDLRSLNPAYVWGVVPNGTRRRVLRVPSDRVDFFRTHRQALLAQAARDSAPILSKLTAQINKGLIGKRRIYYRVRWGDVLGTISRRYGVRVSDIKRWNNLRSSRIYAGQRLKLWVSAGRRPAPKKPTTPPKTVAKPPSQPTSTQSGKQSGTYYIIQRGDTLWDIAQSASMSVRELKTLNNLRSNRIMPGQRLLLSAD